ncbi:Transcriptional regulator, PadR-like family [Nostocoides japonicum T1-X7]|uniref:Transcriptional regulator, PadR-like family n=1 Tax=Nostocoides japonicum T1-X7 TaxID=1194083 RepID=A0A077LY65_9MICO|nr:PadR family transcriptional regulator [Tetrasphaera japonica]CCH76880.1 Transcriptional regulator, PadR-like family [Tetrasphaera japonica T1-X7]
MVGDAARDDRETLLLRGTLDLVVLALLRTPNHAYGVVQDLQEAGFAQTGYGSVYPLVTRLRRQGLLAQESRPSPSGPARNVLRLTPAGSAALREWEARWRHHNARIESVLERTTSGAVTERKAHV